MRLALCGTPEKKVSANTNCRICCGRELKVRLGKTNLRRLDHRDKVVEHLETRAHPQSGRTPRCSARLDPSDVTTRLNDDRPPVKGPLDHIVDGVLPLPPAPACSPHARPLLSLSSHSSRTRWAAQVRRVAPHRSSAVWTGLLARSDALGGRLHGLDCYASK